MDNQTRNNKITQAIKEANELLLKAKKRLNDSMKTLENEKKGIYGKATQADINAKKDWVKKDKERVKELEKHILKLKNMK